MVLSKREKYISIGAISAVVLLGINSLIIGPYYDKRDALEEQETADTKTLQDNKLLIYKQQSLQSDWKAMLASGLEADDSMAQSKTQQALQDWARSANINLDALSSDHVSTQKGPFQVINFNLDFNSSGNQSMQQIARVLWSIESADMPIRLNDMKISAVREGTDNLDVKLIVSSLYMPPTAQSGGSGQSDANGAPVDEMEDVQ
ncbi:MAG TPA: hypothetical protein VGG44_01160 [Tepidisphaeraceae bacterium]